MTKIRDEDLAEVARIFNAAISIGQGHRGAQIVAEAFAVDRTTAWRHITSARQAGLITGREGHYPRKTRWMSGPDRNSSWMACVECRQPWPCPDFLDNQKDS